MLSGCATVINGTSEDFAVNTDPQGATATFLDGTSCTTPCEVSLKRKNDTRIDLTRDGFEPAYVLVQSVLGGTVAGNLLLGGLVGGVVDSANGASNHLEPQPLTVRLAPRGSGRQPELISKDGEVSRTLQAHNDEVRADVAETIGAEKAGMPAAGGSN
jgi:hypothetical protein